MSIKQIQSSIAGSKQLRTKATHLVFCLLHHTRYFINIMQCPSLRDINLFASVVRICILHLLLTKYSKYQEITFYNFHTNLFMFLFDELIQVIRVLVLNKRFKNAKENYSSPPKALWLKT